LANKVFRYPDCITLTWESPLRMQMVGLFVRAMHHATLVIRHGQDRVSAYGSAPASGHSCFYNVEEVEGLYMLSPHDDTCQSYVEIPGKTTLRAAEEDSGAWHASAPSAWRAKGGRRPATGSRRGGAKGQESRRRSPARQASPGARSRSTSPSGEKGKGRPVRITFASPVHERQEHGSHGGKSPFGGKGGQAAAPTARAGPPPSPWGGRSAGSADLPESSGSRPAGARAPEGRHQPPTGGPDPSKGSGGRGARGGRGMGRGTPARGGKKYVF
jgi:hypothetical protein